MNKTLFIIISLTGGIMSGLQSPINSALGKRIGPIEAAFINFSIGLILLTFFTLLWGTGDISKIHGTPKWLFLGGILGAFFVTANIISVPKIGVASVIFAVITGQMVVSIIIDNFGLFGVPQISFDIYRLLGVILMILGLFFVLRGNFNS